MSDDGAIEGVREVVDRMHQAREKALSDCRALTQTAARCIRHVHRNQLEDAERILAEARSRASSARAAMAAHPQLLYAGYLQDAEKEMVEAAAVIALVQGRPLPSREELAVEPSSYLNGMAEAASECRRYVLDLMREGELERAMRMLDRMEGIYDDLITFDYPDSLTGGLRRSCDALRAVLERTRSDLTMTHLQRELVEELRRRES